MGCGEWPVGNLRMWLSRGLCPGPGSRDVPSCWERAGHVGSGVGQAKVHLPSTSPEVSTQVSLGPVSALSRRDVGSAGRVLRPWPCGTVSLRNKQCVRHSDPLSLPVIARVPQSVHCLSVFVMISLPLCVPGVHDTLASLRPSCWSPCFEGPQPRANRGGEVGPKPAPCQGGRVAGH